MFEIVCDDKKSTNARVGLLHTAHGTIETPCFLPVATKGAVKTLCRDELEKIGTQAIIANALHLYLKVDKELIEKIGIHKFINWAKPIFTDSGGFQIIRALGLKIKKEGLQIGDNIFTPQLCIGNNIA